MNVPRETSPDPDILRRNFIEAFVFAQRCTEKHADGMMQHIETSARDRALADLYQRLCQMHMNSLLQHGPGVAQGISLAIIEIVKLIPDEAKQAAEERWAAKADAETADVPRETSQEGTT